MTISSETAGYRNKKNVKGHELLKELGERELCKDEKLVSSDDNTSKDGLKRRKGKEECESQQANQKGQSKPQSKAQSPKKKASPTKQQTIEKKQSVSQQVASLRKHQREQIGENVLPKEGEKIESDTEVIGGGGGEYISAKDHTKDKEDNEGENEDGDVVNEDGVRVTKKKKKRFNWMKLWEWCSIFSYVYILIITTIYPNSYVSVFLLCAHLFILGKYFLG